MSYSIAVSLARKRLSLLKNGTTVKSYPVAVGKKQTPTPTGQYTIINKSPNPGGPYGAYWLGFYPHYGIHGTNNPSSIGKEISAGCIRMHNKDIRELAGFVSVGTPVIINR